MVSSASQMIRNSQKLYKFILVIFIKAIMTFALVTTVVDTFSEPFLLPVILLYESNSFEDYRLISK